MPAPRLTQPGTAGYGTHGQRAATAQPGADRNPDRSTLTDLRLLLQLNKAITLGNLDQYEEALAAARQARHDADQVGTSFRLSQAHSALAQLLFHAGRWDDALDEIESATEDLKESAMVPCDRGIAATISFHRGETDKGRQHFATITPSDQRIGHRPIGPLVLARSLDREQDGALPEALAELTDTINGSPDEIDEIEVLLANAVRLAATIGDRSTGQPSPSSLTALPLDRRSRTRRPTHCTATACWTGTRHGCSRPRSGGTTRAAPAPGEGAGGGLPGSSSSPATPARRGPRSPGPRRSTKAWAGPRTSAAAGHLPPPRDPARTQPAAPAGAQRLG